MCVCVCAYAPVWLQMIRNISKWSNSLQNDLALDAEYAQEGLWSPYVRDLFRLCRHESITPELQVEVLGTLANLTTRDLPDDTTFADLLAECGGCGRGEGTRERASDSPSRVCWCPHDGVIGRYGFAQFLYKLLVPGFAEDDIVLEVIMLVGVIGSEANSAPIIAGSNIIRLLDQALTGEWREKQLLSPSLFCPGVCAPDHPRGMYRVPLCSPERAADAEIVLQTLFTFFRLLHHPETAEVVIYDTAAVTSMCDAVNPANNPEIVRIAEQCLDYVIVRCVVAAVACLTPRSALLCGADDTLPHVFGAGQDFDMRRTKQIAARVQQIRYEQHNRQFLTMLDSEMSEEAETKRWMVRALHAGCSVFVWMCFSLRY